jgi:hypothetical protein
MKKMAHQNKARTTRNFYECSIEAPLPEFHRKLFAALAAATPIRVTERIPSTKRTRALISAALAGFPHAYGCEQLQLNPVYRRRQVVGIRSTGGAGQVWLARRDAS